MNLKPSELVSALRQDFGDKKQRKDSIFSDWLNEEIENPSLSDNLTRFHHILHDNIVANCPAFSGTVPHFGNVKTIEKQ